MLFSRARRKLTLQTRTSAVDGMGSVSETWADLATVWAERKNLRGKDREQAAQIHADAETLFCIRYSTDVSGVSPRHRVSQGGEYFDILEAVEVKGDAPDRIELYTRRAV